MAEINGLSHDDSPALPDNGNPPARKLELAEELAVYRKRLPELLEHEGEFVLIKHQEVIGFYSDRRIAVGEGYRKFGIVPFFVKQIREFERPLYIPGVVL